MEKSLSSLFSRKSALALLAVAYLAGAILSAWNIIARTTASTDAIEHILETYNMKNESAKALENYTKDHPILGSLFSAPLKHAFELPSHEESDQALGTDVRHLLVAIRHESSRAAWWSWFLLSLSLFYLVMVVCLERSFTTRPVLFSLTAISVAFFFIGILAPAMVIWTAPVIPMATGDLSFVVQHQVRGIAAIIWELLTAGHGIIGGFLLLFSILTPLTKASLTFFITTSKSRGLNHRIGRFLHTIGKWSMADVFVAAIILALYALKFQEATKSIPCLGLYYFIGYCLLSLTTTELLVHSGAVAEHEPKKPGRPLGPGILGGLLVLLVAFISGSSLYTYQQYTENMHQRIAAAASPQKLNNADLVLPVHK